MKIIVTRDSVHPGDDIVAPHRKTLLAPKDLPLEKIILKLIDSGYFPTIQGGKATWSIESKIPLAVVAQQWSKPKMIADFQERSNELDIKDKALHLFCKYHTQVDPEQLLASLKEKK